MKRTLARIALALTLSTASLLAAASPAQAAGYFEVRVDVADNGGATATLTDTLMPGNKYLLALTATGGGTCALAGPTVQIAGVGYGGFSNPVSATVSGACRLYNGAVMYTASWTGLPGASGQFPVHCTWVLGVERCSLKVAHIDPGVIEP